MAIVRARVPAMREANREAQLQAMVQFANLTRQGFKVGDLSTLMSPRSLISWAENLEIFGDLTQALYLSFINKGDESERTLLGEYFQRCFDLELRTP
jgi:cobaltochelatase CobS